MQRMRLLVSYSALFHNADRARQSACIRFERRQGSQVESAIKREAAGRAFEASCTSIDGQVFNSVSHVRSVSRHLAPGERAMDHVAVVEHQQKNSGATVNVYRRVQKVGESPDVRRITLAAPAGLQGSSLIDADAMTVE